MGEEEEGECQECRAADRSFLLKERQGASEPPTCRPT